MKERWKGRFYESGKIFVRMDVLMRHLPCAPLCGIYAVRTH